MKQRLKKRLTILGLLFIVVSYLYWNWLPAQLFDKPYSSVVYDKQGQLLDARVATDEQWRFEPKTILPSKFKRSIITFEDKRYFSHFGFDPIALGRAILLNIKHNKVKSGASTISMQVIRLSRGNRSRTFFEKLKELLLSVRLEMSFSKEDILTLYASHAPFGGNIVGIEAASWHYFGRKPNNLSWAESAMLAVLPNQPSLIRPGKNTSILKKKRDRLLKKLFDIGDLTQMDFELALQEPIPNSVKGFPHLTPHLLSTLLKESRKKTFHTTLIKSAQEKASERVQQYIIDLEKKNIHHAAALIIDNRNQSVVAYVGNGVYSITEGSSNAVDLIRRPRSTGSTLKPLLYAMLLQSNNLVPSTLVSDIPTNYYGYIPQNYDMKFRGGVRAKEALSESLNIPAVRMLGQYGVEKFYHDLKQFQLSSLFRPPKEYGLPLILGGAEATLWDLTQLYSNLAHRAQKSGDISFRKLSAVNEGTVSSGIRKQARFSRETIFDLDQGNAWLTLQALLDVVRPGDLRHWRSFNSSQSISWKTGTSFGQRDAWSIGVTPQWTIGVWAGNAQGNGVAGLTGAGIAAPLMFDLFAMLPSGAWFKKPSNALKVIQVCKDNGFKSNGFCETKGEVVSVNSDFTALTPHHVQAHIDQAEQFQVHSGCELVSQIKVKNYFRLAPIQAFYFRQFNNGYQFVPPFRDDCLADQRQIGGPSKMAFVYPALNAQIYLPKLPNGARSEFVAKLIHQDKSSKLYWHLDDIFLGETTEFHEMSLRPSKGAHSLIVVDTLGNTIKQKFHILNSNHH